MALTFFSIKAALIPLGNRSGDILIPMSSTFLITVANNDEKIVNEFQEKVSISSSFNLANMLSYVSQQTISKWPFSGHCEY